MKDKFVSLATLKNYPMTEYNKDNEHPTPEQMLLRQAIKYLTPKQKVIWEYHNYDRLTQDEIASKLKMTQQGVEGHIRRIEKRIAKYCKDNLGAYELLKSDFENNQEDE
jgi:RNA polymerase sigma factor (sigma-70 family)